MRYFLSLLCLFAATVSFAQFLPEQIHSDFVLNQRRLAFDKNMRERTINGAFAQPLDSNTEDSYREACWAISQFLLASPQIEKGFRTLFDQYTALDISTRKALIEAVYGVYPSLFLQTIQQLIRTETDPKLFAMQAVYLYRADSSAFSANTIRQQLYQRFPLYATIPILSALDSYLQNQPALRKTPRPNLAGLFSYNRQNGIKAVYSFQRWNRDWPGLAIVQLEDGNFASDSEGRLLMFRQLARSASNLPFFITNGSTPQGIYSIQGTGVSHNHLIGPTPNLQLILPGETDSLYWHGVYDSLQSPLVNYLALLPPSWRSYAPMMEAYTAGHIGRTEIIAHGTTIDPDYYKDKPYYPLTPTMGCLCAPELWSRSAGTIIQSEQLRLANAFVSTPGTTGYLFVINLDNRQQAVEKAEIETLVNDYLKQKRMP
ncbi:hypothetical protein [Sediminibacterium soli]|uniref:hypothetical protein n=1 Tax=Sediminibacterium soli TaxID=2698829 RepID=UPI001379D42B|nr:hypothetical protein [Sediminibacterium soli]NCI48133.1 hypothetical protein [Sediminibacterium soli]